MDKINIQNNSVFNSPFELGIRMVFLLNQLGEKGADLQKLVLLDYAIIYSGDFAGPESLHTPVPHRCGELMSRRSLIEEGIHLMAVKNLITAELTDEGIVYLTGENAASVIGSLTSRYYRKLDDRCCWAAEKYALIDSMDLTIDFSNQGHLWGAELEDQYLEN